MLFVIRRINRLTIPAGGEHEFKADAIYTIRIYISFVGQEMAVQGAFGGFGVVETVKSDGFLAKGELRGLCWVAGPFRFRWVRHREGKVSKSGVTSYHLEPGRESRNRFARVVI
jgi:hypothetical protein